MLPLFDSGSADGFLYYVMPYIEGETLRTKLDREHQLGIEEAVKILDAHYYSPWAVGSDSRFIMARSTDTGAGAGRSLVVVENWLAE